MGQIEPIESQVASRFEKASELRRRAEEVLKASPPRHLPHDVAAMNGNDMRRILHELQTYQIELEMQNEELRRSQEELDAARARYFGFYDLTPVGYLTVNANGLIAGANLTASLMLGVARGVLIDKAIHRFVLAEDRGIYHNRLAAFKAVGEQQACDLRLLRADGSSFWVYAQMTSAGDGEYRLTLTDISERKAAEVERERLLAELKNSQAEVKTLRSCLPICCHCKSIRNDQGYWEMVEAYITSQNLGVSFTHGICPSCVKKHHPEEFEMMVKKGVFKKCKRVPLASVVK